VDGGKHAPALGGEQGGMLDHPRVRDILPVVVVDVDGDGFIR